MGNAVNLQTRQVRKIVNELHQDYLVCECVSPGGPPWSPEKDSRANRRANCCLGRC
jgi:hypothetical protein